MRAPDARLLADLGRALAPERVLARPIDRLARSVDASLYRLIPEVVVRPRDLAELRSLLECARRHRRPLTFRSAGTSLSGQAVTEGILVELAPFWKACRVLDGGRRVWTQPGVVGRIIDGRTAASPRPDFQRSNTAASSSGRGSPIATSNSCRSWPTRSVASVRTTHVRVAASSWNTCLARARPLMTKTTTTP